MIGSSEAIDLRAERCEKGLRLSEFGELLGRWEAFDCRCQHGVGIGVAIGRAMIANPDWVKRIRAGEPLKPYTVDMLNALV